VRCELCTPSGTGDTRGPTHIGWNQYADGATDFSFLWKMYPSFILATGR
jgi:hypothetical protein